MILEARDLSFGYKRGEDILNGFSFAMSDQERVGLVAPSGRGKTTLCRLLAGYLRPDRGQVLLDGLDLGRLKGYCPVQMIWQHPEKSVNPRLKMKEVLDEGDDVEPRVLEGLGIEEAWLGRYPGELSGGEIQRFCIARALGRRTKFIIADEISTMLDLITQSQIWSFLLKELEARSIGLLAVTHSNALMERVARRTVILDRPASDPEGFFALRATS
ncbi:ATP-binding cassette domain-containing protein [Deltaproteobacteria bacterium OttesenSCG-928-K17]|nr:ATP-binding cassette domain-containing protein [Deltaproteobacteria bacterium OttesenSCG-928-K17]